jgi:hypothetical protein
VFAARRAPHVESVRRERSAEECTHVHEENVREKSAEKNMQPHLVAA